MRRPAQAGAAPSGLASLHAGIAAYYTGTLTRFGATPLGVDWSCEPTQQMRFVQLLKLCDLSAPVSIDDVGCGYGALLAFLHARHPASVVDYLGIDLSAAMVRRARRLWRGTPAARFVVGHASPRVADYSVASGIFNVQLEQPRADWELFVADTLDHMHAASVRGFAVNFIQAPPPGQTVRRGLYATDPARWADHCTRRFGAVTEVIEGYGLREFSLLVRPRGAADDVGHQPRPRLVQ
jgi:SAM-dependent methyltransferase